MKTEQEIKAEIRKVAVSYKHVLTGSMATSDINASRALLQVAGESRLRGLHWVLGTKYKSKLKGVN